MDAVVGRAVRASLRFICGFVFGHWPESHRRLRVESHDGERFLVERLYCRVCWETLA